MPPPDIICLAIDGLRASALGTYGAAWCDTPAFDRLAGRSFVFDQALIDSTDLNQLYRGYWLGLSATLPDSAGLAEVSLPAWLEQHGYRTVLITDESAVAEHTYAHEFQTVRLLSPGEDAIAEDVSQTQMARLFADLLAAMEELRAEEAPLDGDEQAPYFIWLHAQGMTAPWDAPQELRQSLADEEDPEPPVFTHPPQSNLPTNYDPDELLGITQAYSGQVIALDECLDALLEYLETDERLANAALLLLGTRGYPLGEHLRLGIEASALYDELIHVPAMFLLPEEQEAGFRSQALIQPADIALTLAALAGAPLPAEAERSGFNLLPVIEDRTEGVRKAVIVCGENGQRAIRTAAWHLCWGGNRPHELYVKPDDRWEANEISSRCPELVSTLQAAANRLESSAGQQHASDDCPLDDSLFIPQ